MNMTNTDKFLYYGVWGVLIGVATFYGFQLFRGLLSPLIVEISKFIFSGQPSNPELMLSLLNVFHTALSAAIVGLVAVVIIVKLLKTVDIKYCIVPSVVILAFSYVKILLEPGTLSFQFSAGYPAQLVNPIILVVLFVALFWVVRKFTAPNSNPGDSILN